MSSYAAIGQILQNYITFKQNNFAKEQCNLRDTACVCLWEVGVLSRRLSVSLVTDIVALSSAKAAAAVPVLAMVENK
jgi:hypothetical protein